jgi:hypothetical protein
MELRIFIPQGATAMRTLALEFLFLTVSFWVSQDFFALLLHALQAAADGVNAGGEPSLEHGHREAENPAQR